VQSGRVRVTVLLLAVAVLSLRIEALRRVARAPECNVLSVEIWLPLLLALYDALRFQKNEPRTSAENFDASIYRAILHRVRDYAVSSRWRIVGPMAVFCLGCRWATELWAGLNSTFICPINTGEQFSAPAAQIAGLILDLVLCIMVWENFPKRDGAGLSPRRNAILWSSTMAGAAIVWTVVAGAVYFGMHRHRYYVVLWDVSFVPMAVSFTLQALLFSVLCITTLHSVSQTCTTIIGS
jgi:hypothetical protein